MTDEERLREAERSVPMPDWSRLAGGFGRGNDRGFSVPPSLRPYVDVTLEKRRGKRVVRAVVGVQGTF